MTALPQAEPGPLPPGNDQGPVSVDLSTIEQTAPPPTAESEVAVVPLTFRQRILTRQETVRTALAVGAFSSLVAILAILLISVAGEITADNIEQIATVVVTPLTGIVGTIIGFYFAERRDSGEGSR